MGTVTIFFKQKGTTTSPFSFYEVTGATSTKHVYGGDTLLATIDKKGTTTTLSHTHGDHLGSTAVQTDLVGTLSQVLSYYPYGGMRIDLQYGGANQTNRYIGQDYDSETQLNYLQQRYQHATHGQFVSVDPVFLDIGLNTAEWKAVMRNPQAMNSYSYAGNNPVTYSDPNGRFLPLLIAIGYVLEAYSIANVAVDVYSFSNVIKYPEGYSSTDIDEVQNRLLKDLVSVPIGFVGGKVLSAGMNTFDAIYDTTIHVGGKVKGVVNTIRNSSGQGGSNIYQTTPSTANINSGSTNTQTYISAPSGGNKSSSDSSSSYTATNYLNSAQKALNRGDTKSAEKYINKAKSLINGK